MTFRIAFAAVFLLFVFSPAHSADPSSPARPGPADTPQGRDAPLWNQGAEQLPAEILLIDKVGEGVFRLGTITADKIEGFVRVPGQVNMDTGVLEYLACGPRGKLHESLLKLDVEPYFLQIALLLIGLEPGDAPLAHQGAAGTPQGDPVELWVAWKGKDRQTVRHRAEALILNQAANRPMTPTHWVFSGSQVIDGRFMAQVEHSIAATYHDPFAIFDHPLATGTDDTLYHVNTDRVPPKGTPVFFTIRRLEPKRPNPADPAMNPAGE